MHLIARMSNFKNIKYFRIGDDPFQSLFAAVNVAIYSFLPAFRIKLFSIGSYFFRFINSVFVFKAESVVCSVISFSCNYNMNICLTHGYNIRFICNCTGNDPYFKTSFLAS